MDYQSPTELIKQAGALLRQPADENPTKYLHSLLVCRLGLLESTSSTRRELSEARYRVLHPKDSSLTELDRTTQQNAATAFIQQDLDMLEGLDELICERIGLTLHSALTP